MQPLAMRWVALAAATSLLVAVGQGPLAGPPAQLDAIGGWVRSRPPDIVAMAAIRELALGAGLYLLAVVSIALVGAVVGHGPTVAAAVRLSPGVLRPLLAIATTATVTAGVMGGTAFATGRPSPAPTLWRVVAGPGSSPATGPPTLWKVAPTTTAPATDPTTTPAPSAPSATSRPVPAPAAPAGRSTVVPVTTPPAAHSGRPAVPARDLRGRQGSTRPVAHRRPATGEGRPGSPDSACGTAEVYVVRPGDSFWSIAAARLAEDAGGRRPSDTAVAAYWSVLVEANRSSLPVPGHPDLLFPGDRIAIPLR